MATDEKTQIAPGTVLDGKYHVDKQIGAGGMGAVFLATHTTIGRKVAIKTLHVEYTGDEQVVAQTPVEKVESGKNEKKKKNPDTEKGRFGTTFVGDYDD